MIIPNTIGGVRTIVHSQTRFSLIRQPANLQVLKDLDAKYDRCGRKLMWSIPLVKGSTIEAVRDTFEGRVVYLVGKGPSLDLLSEDDFAAHPESPIIACNEAVFAVEELNILNPVFGIQQDKTLGETCRPNLKSTRVLLSTHNSSLYSDLDKERKIIYVPEQLGAHEASISALLGVKVAEQLGAKEFRLLAFDACSDKKNNQYASRIGYSATRGGTVKRFLAHKDLLLQAAGRVPVYFCRIDRSKLTGATEQPSLDNQHTQNVDEFLTP